MALSNSRLRIKEVSEIRFLVLLQGPRISVFKSNTNIYAQIIDDEKDIP